MSIQPSGNSFEAIVETDATDTIFRSANRSCGIAEWLKDQPVPDAQGIGTMINLAENSSYDFELETIVAQAAGEMTTVNQAGFC